MGPLGDALTVLPLFWLSCSPSPLSLPKAPSDSTGGMGWSSAAATFLTHAVGTLKGLKSATTSMACCCLAKAGMLTVGSPNKRWKGIPLSRSV
jgi:hypothetical protein